MELDRIRIKGFRRLLDVDLELRPFQAVIGVNGSGKTSLLDAIALLAASARGLLTGKLSESGGIADVITRDQATALELGATTSGDGAYPIEYALEIEPQGQGHWVKNECLSEDRGQPTRFTYMDSHDGQARYFDAETKNVAPLSPYDPRESLLSRIFQRFPAAESFRSRLASTALYGALDVAPNSRIRMPQYLEAADLPGPRGESLVSSLYGLRESDPDRFDALQDSLRAGFPDFEKLAFPPAAAGVLSMTWHERSFSKPLYMHQLSEGTLRFLWLAALLQSRAIGAVTLLDEPDVSLHPELQRLLVDLMREASRRTRIIVATHSDRFVRFLKPEELLVIDTSDGIARVTRADKLDLEEWLANYSLDELWASGHLGGRA